MANVNSALQQQKSVNTKSHKYGLATVTSETSMQLRQLIDGVNGHINALQILGQQPTAWGSLLIYLITTKLDKASLREWETVSEKNEISTVEKLGT